ncbi:MAG: hypothetical protein ABJQ33_16540 [Alloalcanivorax venustensis]
MRPRSQACGQCSRTAATFSIRNSSITATAISGVDAQAGRNGVAQAATSSNAAIGTRPASSRANADPA